MKIYVVYGESEAYPEDREPVPIKAFIHKETAVKFQQEKQKEGDVVKTNRWNVLVDYDIWEIDLDATYIPLKKEE